MKRLILTIVVLFVILATCNETGSMREIHLNPESAWIYYNQKKISKIDSLLLDYQSRYRFNGNVLVADNNHIIYQGSFENRILNKITELNQGSIFQLASISKQFTAMAVMILKERGLIRYSDSVVKYLPDLPWPNVTIEHLLQHTGGLPNYMWVVEHYWKEDSPPNNTQVIELIRDHENEMGLYFRSGTRFNYSNTGYMVLASLVEIVSGQAFPDFMEENIFKPLGMKHSFVYPNSSLADSGLVQGYRPYRGRYISIPQTVNDGSYGDKGVYSTISDLYLWDQALNSEKLVSRKTLEEAFSPLILRGKYKINYGFGFRIKEVKGKKIVYHHGRWNGFRTSIWRYPEGNSSIIILNNSSFSNIGGMERKIQEILFSD